MSVKSKFKSNSSLSNEGKWFVVGTNSDGSVCRVKLRRSGRGNLLWPIAFRKHTKGRDTDALTPQEDEQVMAKTFSEACVVDWENMQPEDDGVNVKCTQTNDGEQGTVETLLTNPDWVDLFRDWQLKADDMSNYQDAREGEAKN